jgi:hypothetical protein
MNLLNEFYQLCFFTSIFFIIRLVSVMLWRFKAFRTARKNEEDEMAKQIVFTLTPQDKYLLLLSVGIILAYLI